MNEGLNQGNLQVNIHYTIYSILYTKYSTLSGQSGNISDSLIIHMHRSIRNTVIRMIHFHRSCCRPIDDGVIEQVKFASAIAIDSNDVAGINFYFGIACIRVIWTFPLISSKLFIASSINNDSAYTGI